MKGEVKVGNKIAPGAREDILRVVMRKSTNTMKARDEYCDRRCESMNISNE